MASYSDSPSKIIVAWATRVSLAQLGARLCAYAETKATITTFRFVVRHTNLTACRKLPEEIISLIASKIRDIAFKQRMKKWVRIERCLNNECTTLSHVPKGKLGSLAGTPSSNHIGDDVRLHEGLSAEATCVHQEDLERYSDILANLKGTSRFAECVQIFTQDFGIHPYFMMRKAYDYYVKHIDDVYARAYLTLPLLHAPMSSDSGPGVISFSVSSALNPSALVGPTEDQLRKFKLAANTLELHVYIPDEECTKHDSLGEARSSDGDTESGESMDGEDEGNGAENYGAERQALTLDEAGLQLQKTAENTSGDSNFLGDAPEPTTEQARKETYVDSESEDTEALWLRLMILGCGELEK